MFKDREIKFFGTGTVGKRGQIVVPAKAREFMKIEPGDEFIFFSQGATIHMVKANELEKMLQVISQRLTKKTQEIKNILKKTKK
jgi:AbrB family looped-hinge helix DNA binding protein